MPVWKQIGQRGITISRWVQQENRRIMMRSEQKLAWAEKSVDTVVCWWYDWWGWCFDPLCSEPVKTLTRVCKYPSHRAMSRAFLYSRWGWWLKPWFVARFLKVLRSVAQEPLMCRTGLLWFPQWLWTVGLFFSFSVFVVFTKTTFTPWELSEGFHLKKTKTLLNKNQCVYRQSY